MNIKTAIYGDITNYFAEKFIEKRRVVTRRVREASDWLKLELRSQVERAGLGSKVANAWRNKHYGREASYNPASLVWSKAPKIHAAFSQATVIKPVNGSRYLAIPTDNVPRRGSGTARKPMTPVEVESFINGDLEFVKYGNGRPGGMLVAPSLVRSNNKRGWRRATAKRLQQGRKAEAVIMFYLVPEARLKKSLDIDGAEQKALSKLFSSLQQDFGK